MYRHVSIIMATVSNKEIRNWFENDRNIKVLDEKSYPLKLAWKSGEITTEESAIDFQLSAYGERVAVLKSGSNNPIELLTVEKLPADLLATSMDLDYERRMWKNHITHLLLLAPGYIEYVGDTDDGMVIVESFEEADAIQSSHRIYPDAITQHSVLTSVFEMASTARFISELNQLFRENLGDNI